LSRRCSSGDFDFVQLTSSARDYQFVRLLAWLIFIGRLRPVKSGAYLVN
jgi:hypothetical protein